MDFQSYTGNTEISVLDDLYQQFLQDPASVGEQWRHFFEGFDLAQKQYRVKPGAPAIHSDEFKVLDLIRNYRERGHYFTRTNPVRTRRKYTPTLDPENFGLQASDMDREFEAGHELGLGRATLRKIIETLQATYCQSVGVEYMYIRSVEVVRWIREQMESVRNTPRFSKKLKQQILESITRAVGFEKFIHKKFPGYKSFSLEGGEALIPAMEAVIERAASLDYQEFVIGMSHRGRLNVLANILHKPYGAIFKEFEGLEFEETSLLGDVKYHLGHSSETHTSGGRNIRLTLSPNPSHLEAVDPVVGGIARSMADHEYEGNPDRVLPLLIHGDAALAGQGIVYETVQMSELPGYRSGGTIHLVVNNQLGFTTNYLDGRSAVYCTDVAKIIQSPIFHVNGDDVEAVVYTALMALEFRHRFHKDVFIDILCYRKYGHNESDEPRYTQPTLYKIIEKHPNPLELYREQLLTQGVISQEDFEAGLRSFNQQLEQGLTDYQHAKKTSISDFLARRWHHLRKSQSEDFLTSPDTFVSRETFNEVLNALCTLDPGKNFFRKIIALQEERKKMPEENRIDWALAELLAFGTLLKEGFPVRLSGQDVKRGTFSQRHAVFTVEDTEEEYIPLNNLSGAPFTVYNSLLSEYGVLGFEFGHAWAAPDSLTLWEAQFGDFMNGAQVQIDQFIAAAEEKWNVSNGLVMLLPHGYEGQGPEHSSARIERFLASCAHENLQVVQCSTPANYFHVLRRQLHRPFRKPLIVFTPKSLLRHPHCVSATEAFTQGRFLEVIPDAGADPEKVRRVLFCTGKVFYDLHQAREQKERKDVAIIRIEQLYPFPQQQIDQILEQYPQASEWLWVQEEPANMGAWSFILRRFHHLPLLLVARPDSGSPATGSSRLHKLRQQKIIDKAFGEGCCERRSEECHMLCAQDEANFLLKMKKEQKP